MTYASDPDKRIAQLFSNMIVDEEIGKCLGLTDAEVKRNMASLIEKLGLVDRADLISHLTQDRL